MEETQGWADFDSYIGMARRAVNAELRVKKFEAELALFVKCDDGACKPEFEHEGMTVYHKREQ